jgi:hypothetical protein
MRIETGERMAYLEAADHVILHLIVEQRFPRVVVAAPAPDILVVPIRVAAMQDACADHPHDDVEAEERH